MIKVPYDLLGKRDSRSTKYGSHKHCCSENMFLVCYMVSQDHMIEGPCNFKTESFSLPVIPYPPPSSF